MSLISMTFTFFFFNDTATTEIYTLSLHDALPIWKYGPAAPCQRNKELDSGDSPVHARHHELQRMGRCAARSEEHTSELQSRPHLVCRLLLEKKKKDGSSKRPHIILTRYEGFKVNT